MKLNVFNKGLNLRVEPHLIDPSQCLKCENVDTVSAILKPVKTFTDSGVSIQDYSHFFEKEGVWIDNSVPTHYIEYQEKLYFTVSTGAMQVRFGGTTHNTGIAPPVAALSLAATDGADAPTAATLTSSAGGDIAATTTYRYKFVNVSTFMSDELDINFKTGVAGKVTITDIQTVQGTCFVYRNYKRKWRLLGSVISSAGSIVDSVLDISANTEFVETDSIIGTYQYVYTYFDSATDIESEPSPISLEEEVTNGSITVSNIVPSTNTRVDKIKLYRVGGNLSLFTLVLELNNVATPHVDSERDKNIDGTLLNANDNDVPPANLQFLTEVNGVFFAAKADKLHFTLIGKPEYWPSLNFLDFEADITGIGTITNGILVFTKLKTWLITGTTPEVFVVTLFDSTQGCINFDTIAEHRGGLLWVSSDGICATTGSEIRVISKSFLKDFNFTTLNAVVHDEIYYLQTTDNILALDFSNDGFVPREFNFSSTRLYVALDVLYAQINGKRAKMFASANDSFIDYTSPVFVDLGYAEYKFYKSIYIKYKGTLIFKILLDGIEEQSITLSPLVVFKEIKIPQNKQRAHEIQFKVIGIGTIQEIEWKSGGRANGK